MSQLAVSRPFEAGTRLDRRRSPDRRTGITRLGNLLFWLLVTLILGFVLSLTLLPRLLNYQTYVVLTGSMTPTIPVGSIVIVVPTDPREIRIGDVISFTRWDAGKEPVTITHRVHGINSDDPKAPLFETKGDANAVADALPVRYLGPAGKVIGWVPAIGHFFFFGRSPLGRVLLLAIPGVIFGILWLWSIWVPQPATKTEDQPDREPALTLFQVEVLAAARSLIGDPTVPAELRVSGLRRLARRAARAAEPELAAWLHERIREIAPAGPEAWADLAPASAMVVRSPSAHRRVQNLLDRPGGRPTSAHSPRSAGR